MCITNSSGTQFAGRVSQFGEGTLLASSNQPLSTVYCMSAVIPDSCYCRCRAKRCPSHSLHGISHRMQSTYASQSALTVDITNCYNHQSFSRHTFIFLSFLLHKKRRALLSATSLSALTRASSLRLSSSYTHRQSAPRPLGASTPHADSEANSHTPPPQGTIPPCLSPFERMFVFSPFGTRNNCLFLHRWPLIPAVNSPPLPSICPTPAGRVVSRSLGGLSR